jgi:hypothetical protein
VLSADKNDLISIPFPSKIRKNDKVYLLEGRYSAQMTPC